MKRTRIILLCMLVLHVAGAGADNLILAQTDISDNGGPGSPVEAPTLTDTRSMEAEAGVSRETLTNGYAPWSSIYTAGQVKLAQRHTYYGSLRLTNRYAQSDTELMAGVSYPLTQKWSVLLEGSMSPSHHVLAKWSTLGQIQYAFDNGWGAHLGLRHSIYNNALTNLMMVTAERYWSDYMLAYTRYQSSLSGASGAGSNRVQFNRYYGERSWIGLSWAAGAELENAGAAGVLRSQVHALTLSGAHWLSTHNTWAGTYEIGQQRQGDLYTRTGVRLGLRHQF
jgi:YaiO family outer membrane protein